MSIVGEPGNRQDRADRGGSTSGPASSRGIRPLSGSSGGVRAGRPVRALRRRARRLGSRRSLPGDDPGSARATTSSRCSRPLFPALGRPRRPGKNRKAAGAGTTVTACCAPVGSLTTFNADGSAEPLRRRARRPPLGRLPPPSTSSPTSCTAASSSRCSCCSPPGPRRARRGFSATHRGGRAPLASAAGSSSAALSAETRPRSSSGTRIDPAATRGRSIRDSEWRPVLPRAARRGGRSAACAVESAARSPASRRACRRP